MTLKARVAALEHAVGYLTRVPIRNHDNVHLGAVVGWFPLVGAAVGAVSAGVWLLAGEGVSPLTAAILAIAAGVLVTGAFHLDGLADSMDALVGGWTVEQRREILKDSRHGTYGVAAMVLQLAAQWSLLADLGPAEGAIGLVVAHSVARGGSVWSMVGARGAGAGLGTQAVLAVRRSDVVLASVVAVAFAIALLGAWGLVVLVLAGGAAVLFSRWGTGRIDGLSGDVLGAAEQIAETVALLTIVVMVRQEVAVPWW